MHQPVKLALQTIGNQNKYQIILVIFLFLILAQANFLVVGPTFIFMNPLFSCIFSDQLVDESQACSRISQCQISNSFTLVAHMELYCDKQAQRNIIQSIIPIGSIVGLLVVNSLSDIKGRKFALIFAQIVGIVGVALTILGGFIQALWLIIIAQFLCGFCGCTIMVLTFVVPTQYCGDKFLQRSLIVIKYSMCIGTIMIGVLYYFYNIWYYYLIFVVLLPMVVLLIISIFLFVQGPYFLYGKDRIQECLQSLKTIAKFNSKLEEYQTILSIFPTRKPEQNQENTPSLLSILKNKKYLKIIIILIIVELGGSLYFNATGYALNQIGYSYGANMIATGIIQSLACFTLSCSITKIPRKSGLIIFYAITIALGFLFFIDSIQTEKLHAFILMGVIRYFFSLAYILILVFITTEAFPMSIQATCSGIVEAIAQVGAFLGPIIITFCINFQIFPIIAISVLAFFTILIPLIFITPPQTQTTQIRQTNERCQIAETNQVVQTEEAIQKNSSVQIILQTTARMNDIK